MIRITLGLLAAGAAIVAVLALAGEPGAASLTWMGWQVRTTAAAAALIIGLASLAAILFWSALVWILAAPARRERAAAESRRRSGALALIRGFLAAAGGEGAEAQRLAGQAARLAEETPQLVRLLAAQAAEAAGDAAAARAAYEAMTGFADMRLTAHRGLMGLALARDDRAGAEGHAAKAYALTHTAPWAWEALFEAACRRADWGEAQALADSGRERRVIAPPVADRARAAAQTARAALEPAGAFDLAAAAAKARPDFPPAAAIAARLAAVEGRSLRAAPLLEAAWKARPHPALWLAWRDLRGDETPAERARRLAAFAALAPGSRESRILAVEQALIAGDTLAAETAMRGLDDEPVTERLASLNARIALALGRVDDARAWAARAAGAPLDVDWSDIDAEGRAFPYSPADWAVVAIAYARDGELAHPRKARGGPTLGDLPPIPGAYVDSAPFIAAAEGHPFGPIVDDGAFGEMLQTPEAEDSPAGRTRAFSPFGRKTRA